MQLLFNINFTIPFGANSKVIVMHPPGNVYDMASNPMGKDDLNYLINNVNKGDVFFDVGANCGHYTLALSDHLNFDIQIHCFEPEDEAYLRLIHNKLINNADWNCAKVAVGAKFEWLKITSGLSGYNHITVGDEVGTPCPVITLDNYIESNNIQEVHMVKMDIEGFEMDALMGARKSFEKQIIKQILLENDGHHKRYGYDFDDFQEFFKIYNYKKLKIPEVSNFEIWTIL